MFREIKRWVMDRMPNRLAGQLRTWRLRRVVARFPKRVVEHMYGPHRLKVVLTDPLAQGWYDQDWPVLPEVALLQHSKLLRGSRVFDIGAHQGVVAAVIACGVGDSGQVIAVEASRHNCVAMSQNRDLNGLSQIEIVEAAVADRPGTIEFNEGLNGQLDDGSRSWGRVSVEAVTIDGLADRFGMPDVVFLDVEGAECKALAGAARVLASRADFFVEVHMGAGLEKLGGSVSQVLSHFPTDQFSLLARGESDEQFRSLDRDDPIFANRFFLIAIGRRSPDQA